MWRDERALRLMPQLLAKAHNTRRPLVHRSNHSTTWATGIDLPVQMKLLLVRTRGSASTRFTIRHCKHSGDRM
jgi:hypothetical protein